MPINALSGVARFHDRRQGRPEHSAKCRDQYPGGPARDRYPMALLVGGIAAFLNYQETVDQNRRINGRARIERAQARRERDEVRRVRRAEVYAEFLSAIHGCLNAAFSHHRPGHLPAGVDQVPVTALPVPWVPPPKIVTAADTLRVGASGWI
jgi:hypothetical protein